MAPAVLLTLCLLIQTAPSGTEPVARSGDTAWTRAQYGDWLVSHYGVPSLYDFVCEQVVMMEGAKRGLIPTEAQVAAAYDAWHQHLLEAAYEGDQAKWENDQIKSGYTPESSRLRRIDELRSELVVEAMIRADRDLSEDQVAARFRANFGENGERISVEALHFNAYHGLVPGTRPDLPALKQAARERAEKVRAAWVAGAKVGELLPDSDDSGRKFIEAGVIAEWRPMLLGKELDAAVNALDKPGDISQPIEVFDGIWLVRLVSRETVTVAQVHDQIVAELRDAPIDSSEMHTVRTTLMERYKPELLLH